MENPPAFDLTQAIQRWRENLTQSPAFHRENLDEIETHLRDSVTALQTQGLTAEESFLVAARRLGHSQRLAEEFGKVNQKSVWLDRVLWMLIGIQVWGLTSKFMGSIARDALAFAWKNTNYNWQERGATLPVTLFALVQVLAVAASVTFCWWLIIRKGAKLGTWLGLRLQQRSAFVVCCLAICFLSLLLNLLSHFIPTLLMLSSGATLAEETRMYSGYAEIFVSPLQGIAMIVTTLILARKSLRRQIESRTATQSS